jgi:hypothetical protein
MKTRLDLVLTLVGLALLFVVIPHGIFGDATLNFSPLSTMLGHDPAVLRTESARTSTDA